MSVISYIAIAAFLLGVLALIYQFIRKESKNAFLFLFIGLAGLVLFVVSNIFTQKVQESKGVQGEVAENQALPASDADVAQSQAPEDVADSESDPIVQADPTENPQPIADAANLGAEPAPGTEGQAEPGQVAPEPDPGAQAQVVPEPAAPILDDPNAPKVVAGKDIDDVKVNENVSFNSSGTSAKGGASLESFKWAFGDGGTAEGKKVSHAYANVGQYEAVLSVTDSEGRVGVAKRMVNVCRPEGKVRYAEGQKIDDLTHSKSSGSSVSGKFTKTFTCSKAYIEVISNIVSTEGCTCKVTAQLSGPKCSASASKDLDNGGEGKMKVRASCSGAPGEYTWTVQRTKSGDDCECSWTDTVVLDVFES